MDENTKKLEKIEQNALRLDGLETNIDRIDDFVGSNIKRIDALEK